MKLDKAARAILGVTALAWTIPLAQANSAEFRKLDANNDGVLSFEEIAHLRDYHKPFAEADRNSDGRLSPGFVQDAEQRKKALLVASDVEGVKDVKDGLQVRD